MIRQQKTAYQIGKIKFLLESKINSYSSYLDAYKIKNGSNVKYDFKISAYRSKSKIGRKRKWVVNKSPHHYSVVYPDLYLAEIILTRDKDIVSLPFSSVLSTVFPSLYNGMILHSSCVTKQNNAYLFLGKSGAGKSTIAELAGEYGSYKIIADDLILIRNINNDFYAFSIPQSRQRQAELKGARVKKYFLSSNQKKTW